jgi:hypothetical protein
VGFFHFFEAPNCVARPNFALGIVCRAGFSPIHPVAQ